MSEEKLIFNYQRVNQALNSEQIGLTASEFHGLMSGVLCGGNHDKSGESLIAMFSHDNNHFSSSFSVTFDKLYAFVKQSLELEDFSFQLLLPDDEQSMEIRLTELAGWINHFLLGLGIVQIKLDSLTGDKLEAVQELKMIAQVSSEGEDITEDAESDYTSVIEYVRLIAIFFNNEFAQTQTTNEQVLH